MDLEGIMLSEISQRNKTIQFHLCGESKKNSNINTTSYTENELVIARDGDREWTGGEMGQVKRYKLPAVSHGDMMHTQHGGCN